MAPEGFVEKNLSFQSGTVRLDGTLALPETTTNPPVVLLLSGSGPTDRDENVKEGMFKFISNNMKTIAAHLGANGYASYRYDKRGVGNTKDLREQTGFNDILNDAKAAAAFLSTLKEVNTNQIYVLGHSEGGINGTILASENPHIKGLIGIASPVTPLDQIVVMQISHIFRMRGKSKEYVDTVANAFTQTFSLMRKQKDWETIDARELKRIFSKVSVVFRLMSAKSVKKTMAKQFRPNWFIQSFQYDFEAIARKVTCPVLLVFGEKDYQVPVEEGQKFEKILKEHHADVTMAVIPAMNHMLRQNPGPMDPKNSIRSLKTDFDTQVLDIISEWLGKKTKEAKKKVI